MIDKSDRRWYSGLFEDEQQRPSTDRVIQPKEIGEHMRILVIEDTEKYIADARVYCDTLSACVVDFASTLAEAVEFLQRNTYDGAISDVFFPADVGASAKTYENAIAISTKLVGMGVHHVFNTAGNHHGWRFNGFLWKTPKAIHNKNNDHFLTSGMIIEAYPKDADSEKDTKQWQAAFRYILLVDSLLQLPDKGESILKETRLRGFPYGEYGDLTEKFESCTHPFVVETFRKYNA